MSSFNAVVVLVAASIGALWGWRLGTKRLYRRSVFKDDDEARGPSGWRRRIRQRYWTTALYAAVAALAVCVVLAVVGR
jgi:hypothetical protein